MEYDSLSRRDFLIAAAAVSAGAVAVQAVGQDAETSGTDTQTSAVVAGSPKVPKGDVLRVGLIGSGSRGTGAVIDCCKSSPNIEIVAIGDLFKDRVDEATKKLKDKIGDKFKATPETTFAGWDNFQKVIATDCDMVILATPPHFRAQHLRAAIDADKHVFMEKPVAVDPIGVRSIIQSGDMATQKGLSVVTGTQRRHDPVYIETLKRIQDGAIGDIVAGECFWCMGLLWHVEKKPEYSEMEWQIRNWLYFDWLSGDQIVEQHVHNLDVINWVMGGPPKSAFAIGGRQVRTDPKFGNIFDHMAVEYEYPNGARVLSMSRQMEGASDRVSEYVIGTKGSANPFGKIEGPNSFKYEQKGEPVNPYVQEHADLVAAIRAGTPLNEARRIAESTMTAIMGRMSGYTGRQISWNWAMNSSKLDLTPPKYEFGPNPINPVPVPGKTPLV